MREGLCVGVCLIVAVSVAAASEPINIDDLPDRLAKVGPDHPRLFLTDADLPALKEKVESEPALKACHDYVIASADAMLDLDLLEREKVGKRLLGVSRTCLRRVTYLAYAYRVTGNKAYLKRAEQEMHAVAGFEDWNPSHFLDVAEMTAALAIGYDWLYNDLSPESREIVRAAIIEKGLNASLKPMGWQTGTNNWNQVCHGGIALGALATLEDNTELSTQLIGRAIQGVPHAMGEYAPDGVYPEGPSYWGYGTVYNVLLIDAIEKTLGTDYGLSDRTGFIESATFYRNATGPTGYYYNFADCGMGGGLSVPMFWFAQRSDDPSLLWHEKRALTEFTEQKPGGTGADQRLLPLLMVWGQPIGELEPPEALHWKGDGKMPIALHRSGWGPDDTFLGIKGGSPYLNHAHMDIGSFVLDMNGVRWAVDLGAQGYHSLESKGIDLWNRNQNSERWTVFRLNNFSHNTLVVNGALQHVKGNAPIVAFSDSANGPFTVVDMLPVYKGQLAKAFRGARLFGKDLLIQDEIAAPDQTANVRWGMVTNAVVTIDGSRAILEQDGKTATLSVLSPEGASLSLYETETPPHDYDTTNPDTRMIGFEVNLVPDAEETLRVFIHEGAEPGPAPELVPLLDW